MEVPGHDSKATSILGGLVLLLLIAVTVLLVDCAMENLLGRGGSVEGSLEDSTDLNHVKEHGDRRG